MSYSESEKFVIRSHFNKGGRIQTKSNDPRDNVWVNCNQPNWVWEICDYRIHPDDIEAEKEYRKKVITHFNKGGKIEFCGINEMGDFWMDCTNPYWIWEDYKYRIKSEEPSTEYRKKVMDHFDKGGMIEIKSLCVPNSKWQDCNCPAWQWALCDYRIKAEYRPLNNEELKKLVGKVILKKGTDVSYSVLSFKDGSILRYEWTGNRLVLTNGENLLHYFTYEDGSPLGVKIS